MKKPLVLTVLALGLVLAGCGSSETATDTAADTAAAPAQVAAAGGRGGGVPEGSGEVVQIDGSTAQVQNDAGQVAVTWTNVTTFTQQVDTDLAGVAVGVCVAVTSDDDSEGEEIAAGDVRITEMGDEGCARGGGNGANGVDGERTDTARPRPTDLPDGTTEGAPAGGRGEGRGTGVLGEVVSVSETGFTVAGQDPEDGSTTDIVVSVSSDATFTATADAKASDITVGRCVTSGGDADDTGSITAETIAISDPVDGACVAGFGGRRPQATE
ncbi:hypothetical protein GCM10027020_38410 [Nocardioides salsibiostraticola]